MSSSDSPKFPAWLVPCMAEPVCKADPERCPGGRGPDKPPCSSLLTPHVGNARSLLSLRSHWPWEGAVHPTACKSRTIGNYPRSELQVCPWTPIPYCSCTFDIFIFFNLAAGHKQRCCSLWECFDFSLRTCFKLRLGKKDLSNYHKANAYPIRT